MATKSDKEHWSNWHVTINFNKPGGRNIIHRARLAVDDLFNNNPWDWLMFFDGNAQRRFTEHERRLVTEIKAKVGFERGPNNGSIHCHIVLEITHWTMVQIDKFAMQDRINAYMGDDTHSNIRCDWIKGEGDSKKYILRYINKTMREEPDPDAHPGMKGRLVTAMQHPHADAYEEEYVPY